jgi:co-chaperonin GroES (HSP10)
MSKLKKYQSKKARSVAKEVKEIKDDKAEVVPVQPVREKVVVKKRRNKAKGSNRSPTEQADQTAIVVAVGTEVKGIPVGSRVLIGSFTGTEYEFADGVFTMCMEDHIMGIQTKG